MMASSPSDDNDSSPTDDNDYFPAFEWSDAKIENLPNLTRLSKAKLDVLLIKLQPTVHANFPSYHEGTMLKSLPANYLPFVKANSLALFGHPSGKEFTSAAQFIPHLHWLITDKSKSHSNCKCLLCPFLLPSNRPILLPNQIQPIDASNTHSKPLDKVVDHPMIINNQPARNILNSSTIFLTNNLKRGYPDSLYPNVHSSKRPTSSIGESLQKVDNSNILTTNPIVQTAPIKIKFKFPQAINTINQPALFNQSASNKIPEAINIINQPNLNNQSASNKFPEACDIINQSNLNNQSEFKIPKAINIINQPNLNNQSASSKTTEPCNIINQPNLNNQSEFKIPKAINNQPPQSQLIQQIIDDQTQKQSLNFFCTHCNNNTFTSIGEKVTHIKFCRLETLVTWRSGQRITLLHKFFNDLESIIKRIVVGKDPLKNLFYCTYCLFEHANAESMKRHARQCQGEPDGVTPVSNIDEKKNARELLIQNERLLRQNSLEEMQRHRVMDIEKLKVTQRVLDLANLKFRQEELTNFKNSPSKIDKEIEQELIKNSKTSVFAIPSPPPIQENGSSSILAYRKVYPKNKVLFSDRKRGDDTLGNESSDLSDVNDEAIVEECIRCRVKCPIFCARRCLSCFTHDRHDGKLTRSDIKCIFCRLRERTVGLRCKECFLTIRMLQKKIRACQKKLDVPTPSTPLILEQPIIGRSGLPSKQPLWVSSTVNHQEVKANQVKVSFTQQGTTVFRPPEPIKTTKPSIYEIPNYRLGEIVWILTTLTVSDPRPYIPFFDLLEGTTTRTLLLNSLANRFIHWPCIVLSISEAEKRDKEVETTPFSVRSFQNHLIITPSNSFLSDFDRIYKIGFYGTNKVAQILEHDISPLFSQTYNFNERMFIAGINATEDIVLKAFYTACLMITPKVLEIESYKIPFYPKEGLVFEDPIAVGLQNFPFVTNFCERARFGPEVICYGDVVRIRPGNRLLIVSRIGFCPGNNKVAFVEGYECFRKKVVYPLPLGQNSFPGQYRNMFCGMNELGVQKWYYIWTDQVVKYLSANAVMGRFYTHDMSLQVKTFFDWKKIVSE